MEELAKEIVLEKIIKFLSDFKYNAGMELEECKDVFYGYSKKIEESKIIDMPGGHLERGDLLYKIIQVADMYMVEVGEIKIDI